MEPSFCFVSHVSSGGLAVRPPCMGNFDGGGGGRGGTFDATRDAISHCLIRQANQCSSRRRTKSQWTGGRTFFFLCVQHTPSPLPRQRSRIEELGIVLAYQVCCARGEGKGASPVRSWQKPWATPAKGMLCIIRAFCLLPMWRHVRRNHDRQVLGDLHNKEISPPTGLSFLGNVIIPGRGTWSISPKYRYVIVKTRGEMASTSCHPGRSRQSAEVLFFFCFGRRLFFILRRLHTI